MKTKNVKIAVISALLFVGTACSGGGEETNEGGMTTTSFKVYGNCGMCEETIEGALKDVEGIEKGDWDKETKTIEVVYDNEHMTLDDIKKKIAAVGYDTEEFRADPGTYEDLPMCCHYDRPKE
tara:strand:- start:3784 stop:4152 length:369 start_codon:yes stop_codon:yes gene_type:complete